MSIAFTYTPRPALVAKEYQFRHQRRFGNKEPLGYHIYPQTDPDSKSDLVVFRDGETDVASLEVSLGIFTNARIDVRLTPSELRELATRLLDAAHDIDTLPAAVLAQEAA